MVYSLKYRRPSHASRTSVKDSLSGEAKQASINESVQSDRSAMSNGIPEALSFDRIIAGGVCPVSVNSLPHLRINVTNASMIALQRSRLHELLEIHRA